MTEARVALSGDITSQLDTLVHDVMSSRNVSGLAVAIVCDGEIAWSGAYGVAAIDTGEPISIGHRFSAMSVTKTLVATALMQLYERGLFRLDDRANDYLDGAIQNEFEPETPVTIRQLFTHTSGLPEDVSTIMPAGVRGLEEHVRLVARTTRRPGESIIYANWGYDAMGLLIERLSGDPLDVYVRRNVLEPLGMSSSTMGNPPDTALLAKGHIYSEIDARHHRLPIPNWPVAPVSPAGGLYSTVEDLSRFLISHMSRDSEIIGAETAAEMRRVHAPDGGHHSGMGLGWRVTRSNGRRMFCHGGDGAGYTAFAGGYPDDGMGVVLLMNTGGAQGARSLIAGSALALLIGARRGNSGEEENIGEWQGRYRSNFWNIIADVSPRDGGISITVPAGLINSYREEVSQVVPGSPPRDGMFHAFQVSFFRDSAGDACFAGGVYPHVFKRWSENIPTEERTDESAELAGTWNGTIDTPMGPLTATVHLESLVSGSVSTPFGKGIPLAGLAAKRGRLEGEFPLIIPGVGEARMFLRLRALSGGRLTGKVYARMSIGEVAMQVELKRG